MISLIKNFPIRTRLWFSLGIMLSLLILVASWNVLYVYTINKKIQLISKTAFPAAASSLDIKLAAHNVMDLLSAAAVASRKDILQDLPQLEETLFTQLVTIKSLEHLGFVDQGQYETIVSHYNTAKEAGLTWVDVTLNENWEQEPIAGRKFEKAHQNLENLITHLESIWKNTFVQSMTDILMTTKKAYLQTILLCGIGVILFVFLSIAISSSLSKPISSLLRVVKDLRKDKDDFSQRVEIHSHDEIGHLAQEFNEMLDEQEKSRQTLKEYANQLEEQKNLFRQVIDEFPSPFIVKDYDGKFVLTNKALANLYNVEDPELMIGKDDGDYLPHLKHAESFRHNVRSIMDKRETKIVYEDSFEVKTGRRHHYMSIKKPFINQKGEKQILVITNDITEMRKAEKTLMQYEKIMSVSHDFLSYEDTEYTYQAVNDTYLNAFQLSRDDIVGKTPRDLFGDDFFSKVIKPRFDLALQGKEVNYETWMTFPALGKRFIDVSYHPYIPEETSVTEGVVVKINDITDRYEIQEKLRHMADHDTLTGLPNRRTFSNRLSQALNRASRRSSLVAVFFIDLDRFKVINDSLGHSIGDKVLQEISNRLLLRIRKSDTLARSGGDEFLLLLEDFNNPKNVIAVCNSFLEVLAQPFLIEGNEIFVTASIGVSMYPHDATNEKELIQSADTAMYQAKKRGRNNYQLSDEEMRLQVADRFQLEKNLRTALEKNEFSLFFQPQIVMSNKKIFGAEALLRWVHPEKGFIPPDVFIPVAEECGAILPLGKWVLLSACIQMQEWLHAGHQLDLISVNISGNQLLQANFTEMVQECLTESNLSPVFLELEITESYLMDDTKEAASQLKVLRELGVSVAIDDFGTSYSSLRYLQQLPISKLKIDRSFVRDIPEDKGDSAIVKTIIDLAHNLEISVIAEGVEKTTQETFLLSQGCNLAQGFMYGKPVDRRTFEEDFLKLTGS